MQITKSDRKGLGISVGLIALGSLVGACSASSPSTPKGVPAVAAQQRPVLPAPVNGLGGRLDGLRGPRHEDAQDPDRDGDIVKISAVFRDMPGVLIMPQARHGMTLLDFTHSYFPQKYPVDFPADSLQLDAAAKMEIEGLLPETCNFDQQLFGAPGMPKEGSQILKLVAFEGRGHSECADFLRSVRDDGMILRFYDVPWTNGRGARIGEVILKIRPPMTRD